MRKKTQNPKQAIISFFQENFSDYRVGQLRSIPTGVYNSDVQAVIYIAKISQPQRSICIQIRQRPGNINSYYLYYELSESLTSLWPLWCPKNIISPSPEELARLAELMREFLNQGHVNESHHHIISNPHFHVHTQSTSAQKTREIKEVLSA